MGPGKCCCSLHRVPSSSEDGDIKPHELMVTLYPIRVRHVQGRTCPRSPGFDGSAWLILFDLISIRTLHFIPYTTQVSLLILVSGFL